MHVTRHRRASYKQPRSGGFLSFHSPSTPACLHLLSTSRRRTTSRNFTKPTNFSHKHVWPWKGRQGAFGLRDVRRGLVLTYHCLSSPFDRVSERAALSVTARFSVITSRVSLLTFDRARKVEVVTELSRPCGRGCLAMTVAHFCPH